MKTYGLTGYPLTHSFSKDYFKKKFEKEGITNAVYKSFEFKNPVLIKELIANDQSLCGLNVTVPYKEFVLSITNELGNVATEINAVNCIKIYRDKNQFHLKGFNTDAPAFRQSIEPFLKGHHKKALILGTGGSSKAVSYVLENLGIEHLFVSRNPHGCKHIRYQILHKEIMEEYQVIINTSPLGMVPNINTVPEIPYDFITKNHLLYDLVYNPAETVFLKKGASQGATIKNGLEMLHLQAELSWEIWNDQNK
ncbi:MAG: shikimate dehydrogenase [Bacteroidales bacterium]|nr:shikimate dehydrogenase [Bacteroidales bacterium]